MEFDSTPRDWIGISDLQSILKERGFPSSRPAIYRLYDEGLPYHQLVPRGRVRFDRAEVIAWIDAPRSEPVPGQKAS